MAGKKRWFTMSTDRGVKRTAEAYATNWHDVTVYRGGMCQELRSSGVIVAENVESLLVQNFSPMAGVKWLFVALTLNVVMCGLWCLSIPIR